MERLTDKQRLFVEHYLTCWNASEAARRAGYTNRPDTAGRQAMLNNVIQEEIKRRISEVAMSADEVLLRLASHARGSIAPFIYGPDDEEDETMDDRVSFRLKTKRARENMHLVKKLKVKKETTFDKEGGAFERVETEIMLHDPQAALVHIGKHLGLFKEQIEHSGTVSTVNEHSHSFEELCNLPTDELIRRHRESLGEVATSKRRW